MSAKRTTRTRSRTTSNAAPRPRRSNQEILAELQRLVQELVEIERQLAKDGGA